MKLQFQLVYFVVLSFLMYNVAASVREYYLVDCTSTDNGTWDCSGIEDEFLSVKNTSCDKSSFTNCNCTKGFWKMTVEVLEAQRNDSYAQVKVIFFCASNEEIVTYKVNKQLCELNNTVANVSGVEIKNVTVNSTEPSTFPISSEASVSVPGKDGVLHIAVAVVKAKKEVKRVRVSENTSERMESYNNFLMEQEATILVVEVEDEEGKQIGPVMLEITGKPGPLSYLPDYTYLFKSERMCAIYNKNAEWDGSVCNVTDIDGTKTSCECDHNSAFAVIFATRNVTVDYRVEAASTILEVVSIVSLLLAAVLLGIYRRRMRNFDRVLVQICLCFALMFTHAFFVVSPVATKAGYTCLALAVVTHYFVVATAILMVMEGALMLTKVLAPNLFSSASSNSKRRRIIGLVVAWILPLIYVGVCAAVGITLNDKKYGAYTDETIGYQACWINFSQMLVVIVPVGLALAINIGIAIRLGILVWRMSKSAEEFKPSNQRDVSKVSHAGKAFRAIAILLPILGLPWIIGFLVNFENVELVFMSMHVVVNGLQGILLLFHYVIFNSEMRACLKRSWKSAMSNVTLVTPTVHFVSTGNTSLQNTTNRSDSTAGLRTD